MRLHFYILENGILVACNDVIKVAQWREENDVQVSLTEIDGPEKIKVSTAFLVQDISFGRAKDPVLFETAVFEKGKVVSIEGRYSTLKDAKEGHEKVCKELNKKRKIDSYNDMEP